LLLCGGLSFGQTDKSDDEVTARRNALELAGAFTNDGFKLRDGHWSGPIKSGETKLIQVNLYAGNEYYFSVAGADKAKKMGLSVYDETGPPLRSKIRTRRAPLPQSDSRPRPADPTISKSKKSRGAVGLLLVCSYK
jgi:hypothetical protein